MWCFPSGRAFGRPAASLHLLDPNVVKGSQGRERRGRGDDPRPDAGIEVPLDPGEDRLRAAVGVEALDVEAEGPRALPQVRIVEPPLVGVERVVHGPEGVLERRRLGGAGRRPRARVAGPDREVTEELAHARLAQADVEPRAEWALEVGVDDDEGRVVGAADVVVLSGRRDPRGGEAHAAAADRPSNTRFAPGSTPGFSA